MTRSRVAVLSLLGLLGILIAAALSAQAGSDPAELDCGDGSVAVGSNFASNESVYPSPEEAAASFASGLVPGDIELVDVSESAVTADVGGERVIAVTVDGRTEALLGLVQEGGGWVVARDVSC